MKRIILIITFVCIHLSINAQSTLAKLEYSYAEEAFNKKEYVKVLKHLGEVKNLLGSTNARVMYLEIMSLSKTFSVYRNTIEDYKLFKKIDDLTSLYITNFENEVPIEKLKAIYSIQKEYRPYATELNNLIKGKNYQEEEKLDDAMQLYTIACDAENPEACKNLANIYNIKEDFDNAKRFNEKAITLGSINAKHNKGSALVYGINGYDKDLDKGYQLLQENYISGYLVGSYSLGVAYLEINPTTAKELLQVAYNIVKEKNAAIYLYLYFPDLRSEQLYKDAYERVKLYLVANPKDGMRNYYLAVLLASKSKVIEALKYHEIACENNLANSCLILSNTYIQGNKKLGISKNKKKAKEYKRKACELNPSFCN